MAEAYVTIEIKDAKAKMVLAAGILIVLAFAWFTVRWQIGSMLAELTPPSQNGSEAVAHLAESLAPSDPMATWLLATKTKEDFSPESVDKAVRLYETVVRLSPNDFRWWIELGRAYEQAEEPAKAEQAFGTAVELAPTYTFPRWQFGNFFLRQGRTDEAFAELRKTTERSPVYREQVFSLAWDYFDKDPQKLESIIDDSPDVRATLALFYAVRGSADNALRVWNTLTDEQKAPHVESAKNIAQGLFEKHSFRQAVEFARQTGMDPDAQPEAVTNGGFEKFIGNGERSLFGWQIYRGEAKLDISPDSSVKIEGLKSLRITLKGYVKPELHNVVQFVAAESGAAYRLTFAVRTENLRSAGPPMVQVVAGPAAAVLGSTEPFENGTHEWTIKTIEFRMPADADGFAIRTVRASCGDECPIVGTLWYDDFKLARN